MEKFNFLQKIDGLKHSLEESQVLEIYSEAETLIGGFEETISYLKDDIKDRESKIEDLKEDVEGLEEQLQEAETLSSFVLDDNHNNIRTISCFESIFNNLDYIPIEELETIVKKYAVL